jgi:Tfp pilus assembly protein PilF
VWTCNSPQYKATTPLLVERALGVASAKQLAQTHLTVDSLLLQACKQYEAAVSLKPNSHTALYNWGVALSDLARALRPLNPHEATACLHVASQKYAASLQFSPKNPQALNNWGLVLQVGEASQT